MLTSALCLILVAPAIAGAWQFVDVTIEAGLVYQHGYSADEYTEALSCAGGVAAGDYDNDGWVDLYVVGGSDGPNLLFKNLGDGSFVESGQMAGVSRGAGNSSGPLFADLDGDGWLDLFVGGVGGTPFAVFRNTQDGRFEDATSASGIVLPGDTFSAAAGDYDSDGDLDLLLSHWGTLQGLGHLWRNEGALKFESVDMIAGLTNIGDEPRDYTFTPNFADINNDRRPDILFANDFATSQVYINRGGGSFDRTTTPVISDENGMGAAIGDYDNDGDLDWFVSSIWDSSTADEFNWEVSGNRLYRNTGAGIFEDATDEAGVRIGYWGWGSAFADLNNDGHLDLFQVNGWSRQRTGGVSFLEDPARLFVNDGDGQFSERSAELDADLTDLGRGVVCFDYDRDGDLDLFIANNSGRSTMLRNDGGNAFNYLSVELRGPFGNSEAVGARVYVTASGFTQMREIRAGSNYVSQDPADAHFGIGAAAVVDEIRIEWPGGASSSRSGIEANQRVSFSSPEPGQASPFFAMRIHPNPFTQEARIGVVLPQGVRGELEIFDVAGRRIRSFPLVGNGTLPAVVMWEGLDGGGGRVSSGVYFACLVVSGETVTRQLTYLK